MATENPVEEVPAAEVRVFLDPRGELRLETKPEDLDPALINLWMDMVKASLLSGFKVDDE